MSLNKSLYITIQYQRVNAARDTHNSLNHIINKQLHVTIINPLIVFLNTGYDTQTQCGKLYASIKIIKLK